MPHTTGSRMMWAAVGCATFTSDKWSFIQALSASIYQTAMGGSWSYYGQQHIQQLSFAKNFPQTPIGDLQYPDFYELKSNTNDYMYQLLHIFEAGGGQAASQEHLKPCFLGADDRFVQFSRSYAQVLIGAMFSNYLDTISADSYYRRTMEYLQGAFDSAPRGSDVRALVQQNCTFIVGPAPSNPVVHEQYEGVALTRPFFNTSYTFAVTNGSREELRNAYELVSRGQAEMGFCSLFNETFMGTGACSHRLVDRGFYDYIVRECGVDPGQIVLKDSVQEALRDQTCDFVFAETVILNLYRDDCQVFDPVDLTSDIFTTTFSILVPVQPRQDRYGEGDLARAFNAALARMASDGELQRIQNAHFNETLNITGLQTAEFPSIATLSESSALKQVVMTGKVSAYAVSDYINASSYELEVLKRAVRRLGEAYKIDLYLNLTIEDYGTGQSVTQKELAKNKLHYCPNTGFQCQDRSYDIALGLQAYEYDENQQDVNVTIDNFAFGTAIYSGRMSLIGNNTTHICVVSPNVTSRRENDAVGRYNYTQMSVSNYSEAMEAVANLSCSLYSYTEIGRAIEQKYNVTLWINDTEQTQQFVGFMFKQDELHDSWRNITTYKNTLISWEESGAGIYYTSIMLMHIILGLAALPIVCLLIFLQTRKGSTRQARRTV